MSVDYFGSAGRRAVVVSVAVTLAGIVSAGYASAQTTGERVLTPTSRESFSAVERSDVPGRRQPGSIRRSLERLDYGSLTLEEAQAAPSSRRSSVGRKILGGALGAVGGFFAGGFLGAKI